MMHACLYSRIAGWLDLLLHCTRCAGVPLTFPYSLTFRRSVMRCWTR
jgi:hypothetical protein